MLLKTHTFVPTLFFRHKKTTPCLPRTFLMTQSEALICRFSGLPSAGKSIPEQALASALYKETARGIDGDEPGSSLYGDLGFDGLSRASSWPNLTHTSAVVPFPLSACAEPEATRSYARARNNPMTRMTVCRRFTQARRPSLDRSTTSSYHTWLCGKCSRLDHRPFRRLLPL